MSKTRSRKAGLLAVLLTISGLAVAPHAQADDDTPTYAELLTECGNGTKTCVFHPSGSPEIFTGAQHQVGDDAFNCTALTQRTSIAWADTTEETNSLGITITTKSTFFEVFSVSFSRTYSHTWTKSHTETSTTNVDVRSDQVGWVTLAPTMEKVKGTYELAFSKPFDGRNYWYVPFEVTGPTGDTSNFQKTRPMTAEEKAQHCG